MGSLLAFSQPLAMAAVPRAATWPAASLDCTAGQALLHSQASRLLTAAPRLQVLLLGEIHTSVADHAWQLASLEALSQRSRPLSLGLEMLPAPRQVALDRYSAGQLDEATFLRQVGWAEVWGHEADLYLPLLRWARLRGVPLLALNAEPELVRRVRREGWSALPPAERSRLAASAPAGSAYRRRLEMAWQGHRSLDRPKPTGSSGAANAPERTANEAADLERFIASQLLRDRTMAASIAAAQRRDPQRLVVALIGRGHLEDGDGVPQQLADLGLKPVLSLSRIALPEGCGSAPPGARLGAYLESDNGSVWVRRLAPGSAAARAGLRLGDRILSVNGRAVDHAGQVIQRVRLLPDGEPLRLSIERDGRLLRLELKLPPHPAPPRAAEDNGSAIQSPAVPSAQSPP